MLEFSVVVLAVIVSVVYFTTRGPDDIETVFYTSVIACTVFANQSYSVANEWIGVLFGMLGWFFFCMYVFVFTKGRLDRLHEYHDI